jgi:predicted membrane-bound spermidine synthase
MQVLFASAVFVSAVLLFWLQPLFSKTVLPLLGGTPSVWNTCMLFYQTVLLVGYAYSHYTTRWLGSKKQAVLHIFLMLMAFLWLPLPVTSGFANPPLDIPIVWLLWQMTITVGVPLFVLSANAPLLQTWFNHTQNKDSGDPYFLYAASNTGTLLVLLAFPFLIEPLLGTQQQTVVWMYLYGGFTTLAAFCAVILWRYFKSEEPVEIEQGESQTIPPSPLLYDRLVWIIWSFLPSALLLGVTQYITTDVASVPFFWVLPLAVYMATFALVFARHTIIPHPWIEWIQPFILIPPLTTVIAGTGMFFWIDLTVQMSAFFVHCMFCHGVLVRSRPHPAHLTTFYFCMALGGVLGSVFVTLIAPMLFTGILEYPLLLLVMVIVCWKFNPVTQQVSQVGVIALLLGLLLLSICLASGLITFVSASGVMALVLVSTLIGPAILRNLQQTLSVRIAFGMVILAGIYITSQDTNVLYRSRDFFGSYKIVNNTKWDQNILYVGSTIHGAQFRSPELQEYPVGYFDPEGSLGDIFNVFNNEKPNANIAICGLGVGSIAAYGELGQSITYYEINPHVYEIAAESGYFTYLSNSKADINTIFGDARITIQQAEDQSFDMIILDAFNSDSIPVHLLTREAFEIYQQKLKPDGWMAVQISNRYLDLQPVIAAAVNHLGWTALVHDEVLDTNDIRNNRMTASWIVLFQQEKWVDSFSAFDIWEPLTYDGSIEIWTDNHATVLPLLHPPDYRFPR